MWFNRIWSEKNVTQAIFKYTRYLTQKFSHMMKKVLFLNLVDRCCVTFYWTNAMWCVKCREKRWKCLCEWLENDHFIIYVWVCNCTGKCVCGNCMCRDLCIIYDFNVIVWVWKFFGKFSIFYEIFFFFWSLKRICISKKKLIHTLGI